MMQLSKIFCIFALALTQNHLLYYLQNITLMEKHHSQPRKAQFACLTGRTAITILGA